MAAGDLITTDYQMEYDGVLMGPSSSYGIQHVDGISMPDVRSSADVARPLGHGEFPGPIYLKARDITVRFYVQGTGGSGSDLTTKLTALGSVLSPQTQTEQPLVVQLPGIGKVRSNVRVYKSSFPTDWGFVQRGAAFPVVLFHASDPRLYSNTESTGSAAGGSLTGGLAFPHAFPHGFGSATPGTISAVNGGNFPTYPTFTVTVAGAGINAFEISNLTTGETFSMTLDLVASDVVALDFDARTALLNGSASRVGSIDRPGSTWFALQPGTNNISFTYSGSGSATLDASWRSAWVL